MLLILSAAAGGLGLSSVPEGVSWEQISMRYLSVRLGFKRVWETVKGEVLAG